MHIEVVNFTGHENSCTLNFYNNNGDYLKTFVLEELEVQLQMNIRGNRCVKLKSCKCTFYDEEYKSGLIKNPSRHEITQIEESLAECVDWNEWEQNNNIDVDDFMYND